MPHTPEQKETILAFIESALDELLRRDLWLNVSSDFDAYIRLREEFEGRDVVRNSAFDPKWCPLDQNNALWLHLVDRKGKPVSVVAGKVLPEDERLDDMIRTRRIWYQRGPRPVFDDDYFEYLSTMADKIEGRITMTGGLWVRGDFRKDLTPGGMTPLSKLMAILPRALTIDRFESDWHVGMWSQKLYAKGYGRAYYMYENIEPCVRGALFAGHGPLELCMGYAPIDETIAMFGNELSTKPIPARRRVASM
jgi:hypothetical protein